jgi:long-subunit acyl-CoA synthetase (AMP-forming)
MVLYCLQNQVKYCPIPLETNPIDHDETPFHHLFTHLEKFKPSVLQLSQPVLAHIHFHLKINTYKTSMFSNLFLSPLLKNNVDLLKKGHLSNSFSDKTVFSAVREQLGGKVRLIFAENTQIPNSQLNTIRVALSSQIIPYYNFDYLFGWTFLASSFDYENRDYALAGSPIGHLEVKLRNSSVSPLKVQDEPYPRGELLIRSLGLSSNVELTEDGWYPTNTFFEMENSGAFKYLGTTFVS